jgi:PleD family two-component response regulator
MTPESALAEKSRNAVTACASRRSVPNMLSKITAMARKPADRNPALPKAKGKILLVGDYPSSQKVRAAILEKQGCAVDTVRDADEGRARWQPHLYDLVLVDVERNPWAAIKVLPRSCQGSESSAASGPFDRLQRSCDYRF